ncbi:MAG TPA: diguanylate cyclase [Arenimonas sp.]|uniref:sensor domain-containing diguanylate cyclase n=1 Tax=Arenimonas sp. TaxID=1872635 RepID=UPI002D7E96EE|nr:diguanylate cyclase [Arenimonas sp.]HEU0152587.1 diguanylate cyclase [Arenimonas sp.]
MPSSTPPAPGGPGEARPGHLRNLPKRTYRFRILGMGLAALPLVVVLAGQQASWPYWAWAAFACLAWPHLAYVRAVRHRDPKRAELQNFVFDSLLAGSYVAVLHFNVLPSVLLMTMATADKVNSGIRGLWLRSLPAMALGLVGAGLFTGFRFEPETTMPVVLACLPIMVIHALAVSLSSYRLVRQVQRQNLQLEALNRTDALTGLDSRDHWQAQAGHMLHRRHAKRQAATLMLVDVDRFKTVNDRHGHAVGDDVLRAIAERLQRACQPAGHAGRLGGDEFAVALPVDAGAAAAIAETLRHEVESLRLPAMPDLRLSISIGLAAAGDRDLDLRQWLETADRALYDAKRAGRNRVALLARAEDLPA